MKKTIYIVALIKKYGILLSAAGILCFSSCKKEETVTPVTPTTDQVDADFVKSAANSDLAEIDLGNLINSKSSDAAIKDFGHMMVMEHTKTKDSLAPLAASKKLTVPTDYDQNHKDLKAKLNTLSGRALDSTYIANQVIDHQATVAAYQKEIDGGKDSNLKAFATKNQPAVKQHLTAAQTLLLKYK